MRVKIAGNKTSAPACSGVVRCDGTTKVTKTKVKQGADRQLTARLPFQGPKQKH